MASPRTLDALRSAVARVLTARGEAPDALRVDGRTETNGGVGAPWYSVVICRVGAPVAHPLGMFVDGNDEAGAVARAWQRVCERAPDAALAAARAVEAGE